MTDPKQNLFSFAEAADWEQAAEDDVLTADIAFNLPLEQPYTYLVPDEFRDLLRPGMRVKTSLGRGNRTTIGYCIGLRQDTSSARQLKPILEVLDSEPLLDDDMLVLTKWIAERFLCGWGQVLESVIPAGVRRNSGTRLVTSYELDTNRLAEFAEVRLSAGQRAVISVLARAAEPLSAGRLCELAGCGPSPIRTLCRKGILVARRDRVMTVDAGTETVPSAPDLKLNSQQKQVLSRISRSIDSGEHETLLLHGVTGSGKTEVYIRAIQEVVRYGRQAIVLVPEISLTPQTIRRFRARFRGVSVLHSHMSDSERHWQWQQIALGKSEVIVGARSAVFAPVPDLGLIVIDEEHEQTFKQDTTPRYHAREVARFRCGQHKVPLILGSATPTLESWLRAARKEDVLLSMPDRVAGLPLPPVVIVDTRNDPLIQKGSSIGRALRQAIDRALKNDGQVILFLNLRGYSPTLWCRSCGEGVKCPDCDLTMTWHRDQQRAVCHSCGHHTPPPECCPKCGSRGIAYFGTGTQKLEEEVSAVFRSAKVLRMDSDSMRKPGSHDEALERFRRGEVQVLLGTQMIAKGLDFPNVTLVGVIDADTMLNQPDMRASERTFQLIAQVAGRTGRSERGGRVLVQTSSPEAPAVRFASRHDYISFAHHELRERRELHAPPFTHATRIILRGPVEATVQCTAAEIADRLRTAAGSSDPDVRVLGAAPAPITRLRGNYRFHLQITAPAAAQVREIWKAVEKKLKLPSGVEIAVDVDPLSTR